MNNKEAITMIKPSRISPLFLLICSIVVAFTEAFVVLPTCNEKVHHVDLSLAKDGYKFGDLTRGLLKKVQEESGSSGYKFGDISRWLDKKAKEQVNKFTKKDNYQFGDMSKEIIRRLKDGEYTRDDLVLFLKIVATIGINITPVASALPMKVLLQLMNLTLEASIAQSVGDKVVTAITTEIDGRMKEMVTGDRNYQLGDITKRTISNWTGKEGYEVGDITKTIVDKRAAGEAETNETFELFSSKAEEDLLDEWDKKLLKDRKEKSGLGGMKENESYKDWDEKFLSSAS